MFRKYSGRERRKSLRISRAVEAIVREGLADVAANVSTLAIQKPANQAAFTHQFVSSHLPVNRQEKYVRKNHPAEPQCITVTLYESIVTL